MSEPAPTVDIEDLRAEAAAENEQRDGEKASVFGAWGRLNRALTGDLPAATRRLRVAQRRIAKGR
jgi:hypothetical protein